MRTKQRTGDKNQESGNNPPPAAFAVTVGLRSEEDVKIHFLVPFLEAKGYKSDCLDFNKPIEVQEGRKRKTIFADAVVYTTPTKTAPLIVCETKAPSEILDRPTKEQVISYARLLPRIAPLALLTNGKQTQVFQTVSKNRIGDLPHRKDLRDDFVKFVVSADVEEALRRDAKHDLFIIDDVQTFKSILKACHDAIRNNEGFDATEAFDEMSKVLFCKMYEEKVHQGHQNRFSLPVFDDTLKRLGVNVVKQILKETKKDSRYGGLFEPEADITLKDRTVREIIGHFENYDLSLTAFDVKGEAFEYFLGETFTGGLGQFFTPRNVVEFMVDAVDPRIGQRIIDPFCGTGGFLIYAFDVVGEKIRLQDFSDEEKARWKEELSNRCLYGTDWIERTILACKMNMVVHGDGSAGIVKHHGLVDIPGLIEEGQYDLCLTNPPFGSVESDPEILGHYELGSGRKSQERLILAIERALRLLKPGGVVATVVIDGVLNNDSLKYVRDYIREHSWVRGVVSLPAVTFEGYHARAKTSILFIEKKSTADAAPKNKDREQTFMSVVTNSGYAPNGAQVAGNELPDVLLDFRAFIKGKKVGVHPNSFVTVLRERMDAEHYWSPDTKRPGGGVDVHRLAESLLTSVSDLFGKLEAVRRDIATAFAKLETKPVRLSDIFAPVEQITALDRKKTYTLLGVRWWGGGTFVRETKTGAEIKARKLNRVCAGWLVYNRLFAYRGSFAVVPKNHEGCFVSNEFPTFALKERVQEHELTARYVAHLLNSPRCLPYVEQESTGSTKTSRNRFKENRFLAMTVAIPTATARLSALVKLLDTATGLRALQEGLKQPFSELGDAVAGLLPGMGPQTLPPQPAVKARAKEKRAGSRVRK